MKWANALQSLSILFVAKQACIKVVFLPIASALKSTDLLQRWSMSSMSLPKMGIEEDAWQCLEHSNKRVGHAAKLQALKLRGQVEFPDQRALFFRFFFFFSSRKSCSRTARSGRKRNTNFVELRSETVRTPCERARGFGGFHLMESLQETDNMRLSSCYPVFEESFLTASVA